MLLLKMIEVLVGLALIGGGVSLITSGHLVWGVILIGVVSLFAYIHISGEKRLNAILVEVNRRHNTHFNREDGFGMGPSVYFDRNAQKLLIVKGKESRVEDFSFIRSWELKWVEKNNLQTGSLSYTDVRIEIHTNDYQFPLMKFSFLSKTQGDVWHSRLGILFG